MIIEFSDEDRALLMEHANMRYYGHRKKGTYEINKFHNSKTKADLEGVYGEWAVCDALGTTRTHSDGVDAGWDVEYNGHTIDVKATSYKTGKLLVPYNRPVDCTDLVLTIVDVEAGKVRIAGGVPIEAFEHECFDVDYGRGKSKAMEQQNLVPWEEYVAYLNSTALVKE